MTISYHRGGGQSLPQDREQLTIEDDGAFTMWRSVASASYPPSPVGRFAGRLDPAVVTELRREADEAEAAGPLDLVPLPDAVIETIVLPGARAQQGIHDQPEGAWGNLVRRLRYLLGDLTRFPRAALALAVPADGAFARLTRLGDDALTVYPHTLVVEAVLWQGSHPLRTWSAPTATAVADPLTTGSGWTLDLPFHHGFIVKPSDVVVAYVTMNVDNDGWIFPVALESPRA